MLAAVNNEKETSFAKLGDLFKMDSLRPLLEVAQLDVAGSNDDKTNALKKLLVYAADENKAEERLKALRDIADTASRLWGFTMGFAQLIAVAQNPKEWAKRVPDVGKQHKSLKTWTENPKKFERLAKAIAGAFDDRYYWGGKKQARKKYGAKDSDDSDGGSDDSDDSTDASSSSSGGSSSLEDKKKKNKNKAKKSKKDKKEKSKKKDKEQEEKKAKKEKAKKGKKESKKSDSSSESDSSDSESKRKKSKKNSDDESKKKAKKEKKGKKDKTDSSADESGKEEKKKAEEEKQKQQEKEAEQLRRFRSWGRGWMTLFKEKLQNFNADTSTVKDFLAMVSVPPTAVVEMFWPEVSDIPLGKPEADDVALKLLQDAEIKKSAIENLHALLAAAEAALDAKEQGQREAEEG